VKSRIQFNAQAIRTTESLLDAEQRCWTSPIRPINGAHPSPFYLFDLKRIKTMLKNDDRQQ